MNDPGFTLPVITPVIGAELCVVAAIVLIISGQAAAIANYVQGLWS
jgi:hypothetical protein